MNLLKTSSCAIQDIDKLSSHYNPKDAMIAFCRQAILEPPKFGKDVGIRNEISSFYLFTAAVHPKGSGSGRPYQPYGKEFYDFIVANDLGVVWESPQRPNKAWHPSHSNQVYVWMPDHKNILAWWAKNNPEKGAV